MVRLSPPAKPITISWSFFVKLTVSDYLPPPPPRPSAPPYPVCRAQMNNSENLLDKFDKLANKKKKGAQED